MKINVFDPKNDRHAPLLHVVSWKGEVPVWRVQAWCLWVCQEHGATVSLVSGIRTDAVIRAHNAQHGTDLHSQPWLIEKHREDPARYAAANSVDTTSHCGRADGNPAYRRASGIILPARAALPKFMWGLDGDDVGKVEDNTHLVHVGHSLGVDWIDPYDSGSEHHHVICGRNPVHVLESANVISKDRHT